MSGGSYLYAYGYVDAMAGQVRERHSGSALHLAFADHLDKVSKAMHDLEWVDSCDYGKGDEAEAIRAVLSPTAELEAATSLARRALAELTRST